MEIIDEITWKALPKKKRDLYVVYNPSLQDRAIGQLLSLANMGIDGFNALGNFYETVKFLPNPTPAEQLAKLLEPFQTATSALNSLQAVTSLPGISQVFDVFKSLFKVVGSVLQIAMLMQKQLELYSDALIKAYESIDWERLKENISELSEGSPNTPGIGATMTELNSIDFPTEKIKSDCLLLGNEVKSCVDVLTQMLSLKEIYEPIVQAGKSLTWEHFCNQLNSVTSLFGLDFAQLQAEVDATVFPDPSQKAQAISEKVNSMLYNKQYILKTDMDILIKRRNEKGTS